MDAIAEGKRKGEGSGVDQVDQINGLIEAKFGGSSGRRSTNSLTARSPLIVKKLVTRVSLPRQTVCLCISARNLRQPCRHPASPATRSHQWRRRDGKNLWEA